MRHLSFRGGALAALLACPFALAHAAGFSTLEERMSYKEFTAYGLDKLSPQQLQGLNEWVQKHNAECVAAAAPAPGTAAAAPTAAANSGTVHSRLVGEFKGWEKGTVLVLEKVFELSRSSLFGWFFWLYNAGLMISAASMAVNGVLHVLGEDTGNALAGIAGAGHTIMTAGLILLFVAIGKRALTAPAAPAA